MAKIQKGVIIKTPEQIEGIRIASRLAAQVLDHITSYVQAGVSTEELDHICNAFTLEHGGKSACINYLGWDRWGKGGYPKYTCISLNEVICHGIPSPTTILKNGDILNIDVTVIVNGYFGDTSRMYTVGTVPKDKLRLIQVTRECLEIGIKQVVPGNMTGDIGAAIAYHAEKNGFSVVRDYTGHGVGVHFHEEPVIFHKALRGTGSRIEPGMIFTIEPMINMGDHRAVLDPKDGWTVRTKDGKASAQFEHTILVTETGHEVLTVTQD